MTTPKMRLVLSVGIDNETNKIEEAVILRVLDDSDEPAGMISIQDELSVPSE